MKKLLYKYSFLLGLAVFLISCEQDRTFPEYEDIEHGAYPRLLGSITGPNAPSFNYNDPANASISFMVEFYDDENGQTVDSYSWTANHTQTGTSAVIASQTRADFGVNAENGRPTASFTFTLQQALDALGLTIDDVNGGEAIDFYATLTTNRGQTFTRTNTNAITQGQPAFRALFQIKSNLICPSEMEGVFDASTTGQGVWAGTPCSSSWTGKVEWINEGNGVYNIRSFIEGDTLIDISMGSYFACYGATAQSSFPNGDLKITDACGKLSYIGLSQWGEVYTFNSITVNGNQLTIDWANSYGETAVTTLTRTDGKDWPTNLRI